MTLPDWAPPEIDIEQPNAARIYDYMLDGSHNFAADQHFAEQVLAVLPDARKNTRANRAFLNRAVRHLVSVGIHQFLDIGSGIPTRGNVHETAPDASVAYVDLDTVAVAHSRAILAGNSHVRVIRADLRDPDTILSDPDLNAVLDLNQPVGLLLVAVLHVIPDTDDPAGIVARLRDALVSSSYLVISHGTGDSRPAEVERLRELSKHTTTPMTDRSRDQVAQFFTGFDLIEPGLVWAPEWHPEVGDNIDHPESSGTYVGVARKP
ncbi:MAG TPA: SAM-dependent methyltransferase [Micromonosporaceae bacterium]|nr:SAM-dependent methyltransferase [Micromonosporaceae bacterium]